MAAPPEAREARMEVRVSETFHIQLRHDVAAMLPMRTDDVKVVRSWRKRTVYELDRPTIERLIALAEQRRFELQRIAKSAFKQWYIDAVRLEAEHLLEARRHMEEVLRMGPIEEIEDEWPE